MFAQVCPAAPQATISLAGGKNRGGKPSVTASPYRFPLSPYRAPRLEPRYSSSLSLSLSFFLLLLFGDLRLLLL